jgi:hypothetical protein
VACYLEVPFKTGLALYIGEYPSKLVVSSSMSAKKVSGIFLFIQDRNLNARLFIYEGVYFGKDIPQYIELKQNIPHCRNSSKIQIQKYMLVRSIGFASFVEFSM